MTTLPTEPSKNRDGDATQKRDVPGVNTGSNSWLGWCVPHSENPFYACERAKNEQGASFKCGASTEGCSMAWAGGMTEPYLTCGAGTVATITAEGDAFCATKTEGDSFDATKRGAVRCPDGSTPQMWKQGWEGFVCKK